MIKITLLIIALLVYFLTTKHRKSGKTEAVLEAAAADLGMSPMDGHAEIVAHLNEVPWETHCNGDLEKGLMGSTDVLTVYIFDYPVKGGDHTGWVTACLLIIKDWEVPSFTLHNNLSSIKKSKLPHKLSFSEHNEFNTELSLHSTTQKDASYFTNDLISFLKWRNPTFSNGWDMASFPQGLMLTVGDTQLPPAAYQQMLESALEVKEVLEAGLNTTK